MTRTSYASAHSLGVCACSGKSGNIWPMRLGYKEQWLEGPTYTAWRKHASTQGQGIGGLDDPVVRRPRSQRALGDAELGADSQDSIQTHSVRSQVDRREPAVSEPSASPPPPWLHERRPLERPNRRCPEPDQHVRRGVLLDRAEDDLREPLPSQHRSRSEPARGAAPTANVSWSLPDLRLPSPRLQGSRSSNDPYEAAEPEPSYMDRQRSMRRAVPQFAEASPRPLADRAFPQADDVHGDPYADPFGDRADRLQPRGIAADPFIESPEPAEEDESQMIGDAHGRECLFRRREPSMPRARRGEEL